MSFKAQDVIVKAKFRHRTSHEPNRMLMRENKGFFSFAFDSAHVIVDGGSIFELWQRPLGWVLPIIA